MDEATYIDFEIVADAGDNYLVLIEKDLLNTLSREPGIVIRHWDGTSPVQLVAYGDSAVRTLGDDEEANNLSELPRVSVSDLKNQIAS